MRRLTFAEVVDRINGAPYEDIVASIKDASERGRGYGEWRIALAPVSIGIFPADQEVDPVGFTTAEELSAALRGMYIRLRDMRLCKPGER